MNSSLTIQIVGWNSAAALPTTLAALQAIPAGMAIIRYIDNHSTDGSIALVKRLLPHTDIIALPTNQGFASAHNIGFTRCTTDIVLTHDPDVAIQWPAVEKLLAAFADPRVAAVQGKLLRATAGATSRIDSAGIKMTLALNGQESGANEVDRGQYNQPAGRIAVTGACGLYRLAALKAVAHSHTEIFDADFFSYKEDVDLGWRLHRAGYKVLYLPITVGTHARTLGRRGTLGWGLNPVAIYRRLQSPRTRYSLRNWIWMIAKNASVTTLITHSPAIVARAAIMFALSCLYPPLLTVWPETLHGLPRMIKKRQK